MALITENEVLPKLRFEEFRDNWEKKKLGDVGKVKMCKRIFSKQTKEKGDIPFYKIGTFGKEADTFIDIDLYNEFKQKYSYPKVGEILMSASGTLGRTVVFNGNPSYYQDSNIVWIANNEGLITNNFLYYIYQIVRYNSEGGTIQRLYNSIILNTKFYKPSLPEQQKIATFLSAVDKKLQQLTKKKELLEEYKKGVMQKIFSHELRFKDANGNNYPDWEEKKLGDFIKLQGGNAFKSSQFKKEGIPIIRISNISNKTKYLDLEKLAHYNEQKNDANYIISKGDLLIAMSGATTGKSSISDFEGKAYLNQRVGLFKSKTTELEYGFLIQFVFSKTFSRQLDGVLVAGAQPNISSKDIENFKCKLPSFEEQQKIANFLSSIDKKIDLVSTQIENTTTFKKGLLQQMFV
jgi:type I restriction enzyme, S subunit